MGEEGGGGGGAAEGALTGVLDLLVLGCLAAAHVADAQAIRRPLRTHSAGCDLERATRRRRPPSLSNAPFTPVFIRWFIRTGSGGRAARR